MACDSGKQNLVFRRYRIVNRPLCFNGTYRGRIDSNLSLGICSEYCRNASSGLIGALLQNSRGILILHSGCKRLRYDTAKLIEVLQRSFGLRPTDIHDILQQIVVNFCEDVAEKRRASSWKWNGRVGKVRRAAKRARINVDDGVLF